MITAEHKKWAYFLFDHYVKHIVKKDFDHFYLVNETPDIETGKSMLVAPNHFSWWDGFFIYLIKRLFFDERNIYLMMLEEQLRRYWFFRKVGCYSVDAANSADLKKVLEYTVQILRKPDSFNIIFPQGEIEDPEISEPTIKPGIFHIIRKAPDDLPILPIAFRIQYWEERKPDIFCRFGNVLLASDIKQHTSVFKKEFQNNIDELKVSSMKRTFERNIMNLL